MDFFEFKASLAYIELQASQIYVVGSSGMGRGERRERERERETDTERGTETERNSGIN